MMDRLTKRLIEDVLNASDAEIEAEAADAGVDPAEFTKTMRDFVEDLVAEG